MFVCVCANVESFHSTDTRCFDHPSGLGIYSGPSFVFCVVELVLV